MIVVRNRGQQVDQARVRAHHEPRRARVVEGAQHGVRFLLSRAGSIPRGAAVDVDLAVVDVDNKLDNLLGSSIHLARPLVLGDIVLQ